MSIESCLVSSRSRFRPCAQVSAISQHQYRFGDFQVDPQSNRLIGAEDDITLEPKVIRLLCHFCEHSGQTLSRDQLLDAVWGSHHFDDSVVARAVSILRRSLGDDRHDPTYIRTVSRRGYQWLPEVRHEPNPSVAEMPVASETDGPDPLPHQQAAVIPVSSRQKVGVLLSVLAVLILAAVLWHSMTGPASDPPQGAPRPQSIAIMPFDFDKVSLDERYLTESLREEIAMHLTQLAQPRIYLMPQSDVTPGQEFIQARTVGAEAVLLGDASMVDGQLNLRLRLQDSKTSEILWVDMQQTDVTDLMPMRNRLITALRRQLDMPEPFSLKETGSATLTQAHTYQTWLKARWHWRQRSDTDLARGHELFTEVVEQAPNHAEAHAWWAMSQLLQVNYLLETPAIGYPRAAEAAQRAMALDPNNAYTTLAMAQVHLQQDLNLAEAESLARRSVELAAGLAENRQFLAEVLSMQNKHAEALQWIDSALQIEPYSALLHGVHGLLLTAAGQTDQAIEVFDELERYSPRYIWHHRYHAYALMREGRGAEAGRQMMKANSPELDDAQKQALLEAIDRTAGQAYWSTMAAQLPAEPRSRVGHYYFRHLEILAANGRYDEAIDWLEPMFDLKSEAFLVLRISPLLDPLRERRDYRAILEAKRIPLYAPAP